MFFARGVVPRLYHLRTQNQLEVDLIVEDADHRPHPFEIKLSKTPRPAMADALERFARLFADISPQDGHVITLSQSALDLSRRVRAVGVQEYLEHLGALVG